MQQVEAGYLKRVLEILEPVVGRDNLRANVTADIDFTQTESTSEEFKPNQGDAPAAVKLLQRNESSQPGATVPSGVPGAASNQPPVPATAPHRQWRQRRCRRRRAASTAARRGATR